ncbi:MAG TPA: DNA repair protein RecO [Chitinophagaceae bacterium]|jgi:DNA repair protein RecO (recombination protein O)|nr:DNA repair protein RecO [Chitinophagaceae bacterium]
MTHKTKGIILRTIAYGETSVITTAYTELFGIQSYIVKGIRKGSKTSQGKSSYFQPGAMLEMEVYHNQLKNLQFVKEFQWSYIYEHVFFNVVKNASALYMVELLQRSLKQPEANPELFYLVEDSLKQLDRGNDTLTANLPLYFTLHLAGELGLRLQGEYAPQTPVLDLEEGVFVKEAPAHLHYLANEQAQQTSAINNIMFYNDLENITLNRNTRRGLLQAYQQFFALHIHDFGELRSLQILQEVL